MRIVAALVLVSGLMMAQGPGMGGGGGMGGMGGGRGGMGEGMGGGMGRGPMDPAERERMMVESLSDQLGLKKDQKKQLKAVLDRGKENVQPLQLDAMQVKGQIRAAVKSGAEAGPLFEKYGAVQAQLATAEAKVFADVLAMLDEKQRQKADGVYNAIPMLMAPVHSRRGR
jgi:hypothetical protein